MDWTYEQLILTDVSKTKTPQQQKEQWQKELNDWFNGFETIRAGDKYIVEERVVQLSCEEFNELFGTKIKY